MKIDEKYSNGQIISEQKGEVLTYYHKDGKIKAEGKYIDGKFQGKWVFNKKEGFLWQVGYFKDNQKHGEWIRYNKSGDIESKQHFKDGKKTNS